LRPQLSYFRRSEDKRQGGNRVRLARVAPWNVRNHGGLRNNSTGSPVAVIAWRCTGVLFPRSVSVLRDGPIDKGNLAGHFMRMSGGKVRFELPCCCQACGLRCRTGSERSPVGRFRPGDLHHHAEIDHVTSVGVVTLVHENAYFEVDRVSLSHLAPPQPCERTPERYLERRPWRVSVGHRQPVGNFRDPSGGGYSGGWWRRSRQAGQGLPRSLGAAHVHRPLRLPASASAADGTRGCPRRGIQFAHVSRDRHRL